MVSGQSVEGGQSPVDDHQSGDHALSHEFSPHALFPPVSLDQASHPFALSHHAEIHHVVTDHALADHDPCQLHDQPPLGSHVWLHPLPDPASSPHQSQTSPIPSQFSSTWEGFGVRKQLSLAHHSPR